MKNIILIAALFLSSNAFADYKIIIQNAKLDLPVSDSVSTPDEPSEYIPEYIPEPDPWEPPSGVPALHPNGVTVACLDMPNGEEFDLNGKTYRVVYTKEDAVSYAGIACTSNIIDMSYAFFDQQYFNTDISHWDTSKVTTMRRMFYDARAFNRDIGNWDVSNVTDMERMFYRAYAFNKNIGNWDTSKVTNMTYTFYNADAFDQSLNDWCVDQFSSEPSGFTLGADIFSSSNNPLWGICPQEANKVQGYSLASNGVTVQCEGMPNGETIKIYDEFYRVTNTVSEAVHYTKLGKKVCTSNLTNMSAIFQHNLNASPPKDNLNFNEDISHWDTSNITDMSYMFMGAQNFNADVSHWDTSKVTTMRRMFYDARSFNKDVGNWDVSNVTDIERMFYRAYFFNQDIGNWDTSNITNMTYTFYNADEFNQNLNDWCVDQFSSEPSGFTLGADIFSSSNSPLWGICPQKANKVQGYSLASNGVTVQCDGMPNGETIEINGEFYRVTNTVSEAVHYTKLGKKVCTSNLNNMTAMFQHNLNASPPKDNLNFNEDISHWDTSNITDMSYMFMGAENFNADISHWDTSKVTTMRRMFYDADAFNKNIGNWDISNVTDIERMFYRAYAFNQNIKDWDTSKITNMTYTFYNADAFNQNLNDWCVDQFSSEPSGFNLGADAFSSSEEPLWGMCPQDANKVQGYSLASNGVTVQCEGMPNGETIEINGEFYRVTNTESEAVHYTKLGKKVCTSNLTDMANMFEYRNTTPPVGDENFNEDISHWDTSNVINMSYMFKGVKAFNVDISHWNTSKVTTMRRMFYDAENFNRNIGNWSVSNVTDIERMFYRAYSFNQNIGSWDTSKITNMTYTFYNADAFNQNLNGWCVEQFASEPSGFNLAADLFSSSNEPLWGEFCN